MASSEEKSVMLNTKKNKKILQLSKYYFPVHGGIELVVQTISKAFILENYEVHVISFGTKNDRYDGPDGEKVYQLQEDIHFLSAPIALTSLPTLTDFLAAEYDCIFVHLPNPFMHEVLKFLKQNTSNVIGIYHSDIVNQRILGSLYQLYFSATDLIYQRFIVSSKKLWQTSSYLSHLENKRIEVIPFCCEEKFPPLNHQNFNGELLFVGRMVPYKGLEYLIPAIIDTRYRLHIAGDGPLRSILMEKYGQHPNIIFYGSVDEEKKYELFKQCSLLINSSINRAEAYGMTIVEAFYYGIPVAAAEIDSGVTFLVQEGVTGALFKPGDQVSLVKTLDKFFSSESFYRRCALGAREFYRDQLSFSNFKKKILACLK